MKYLKRQEGMTAPLVVGLLAVVAIVVGIAVWQSQRVKPHASASPTPTPTRAAQASPTPTTTPAPANEFKVAELGFKMTLPAGIADLKYVAQSNLTGSGSAGTYKYSKSSFSTSILEQRDSSALCLAAHAPLGTITRYETQPQGLDSGIRVRQVGTFYLAFSGTQSACSDGNGIPDLTLSQSALLEQAFNGATPF